MSFISELKRGNVIRIGRGQSRSHLGATEAVQRVGRALIRVLRDPAQREAVREALDDQEYAFLRFWLSQLGSTTEPVQAV